MLSCHTKHRMLCTPWDRVGMSSLSICKAAHSNTRCASSSSMPWLHAWLGIATSHGHCGKSAVYVIVGPSEAGGFPKPSGLEDFDRRLALAQALLDLGTRHKLIVTQQEPQSPPSRSKCPTRQQSELGSGFRKLCVKHTQAGRGTQAGEE